MCRLDDRGPEWFNRHSMQDNPDAADEVVAAFIESFQEFGQDSGNT